MQARKFREQRLPKLVDLLSSLAPHEIDSLVAALRRVARHKRKVGIQCYTRKREVAAPRAPEKGFEPVLKS